MQYKNIIFILTSILLFEDSIFAAAGEITKKEKIEKGVQHFKDILSKSQALKQETNVKSIIEKLDNSITFCNQQIEHFEPLLDESEDQLGDGDIDLLDHNITILDKNYKRCLDELGEQKPKKSNEDIVKGIQSFQDISDKSQQLLQKISSNPSSQVIVRELHGIVQDCQQKIKNFSKFINLPTDQVGSATLGLLNHEITRLDDRYHYWLEQVTKKNKSALRSVDVSTESLTKTFMEYVAKNASTWLKSLPQDKIVTNDVVRNVLGADVTESQVLYSQGFLEVIKA